MASISLTADERSGFTQLPDIFIDEYMNDANEVQLKLYLYLLRRPACVKILGEKACSEHMP